MSADHGDRHVRQDHRNEFALRRVRRASVLSDYFDRVADELHRLVQAEPGLVFAGPDVLFARMTIPETAPDYGSCLRRAALGVLLVRAMDRAEKVSPTTGDAA